MIALGLEGQVGRGAGEKLIERLDATIVEPVDADGLIIEIRRGNGAVEVGAQVNILVVKATRVEDARHVRGIGKIPAAPKGEDDNVLDETKLGLARVGAETLNGIVIAGGGAAWTLCNDGGEVVEEEEEERKGEAGEDANEGRHGHALSLGRRRNSLCRRRGMVDLRGRYIK